MRQAAAQPPLHDRLAARVAAPSVTPARLSAHLLLGAQVASLLALTLAVATRTWQDHVWFGWSLLGLASLVWLPEVRRDRSRRLWFAYVGSIFAYTLLRSYADETAIPIHAHYVVGAERFLFFGTLPVVWLQRHYFSPAHLTPLDWAVVQVHWSFFVTPHLAAVLIFLFRRHLFARYAALVIATLYSGLVLFFLLPTAPPWLAANLGEIPSAFRVMDFVGGTVNGGTYQSLYSSLGEPNSVAAMPSIHMAVTFAMYLWARDHYPRFAPLLLLYSLVMGFSLVYMAEHYVVDLAVGVLLATGCHLAIRRLVAEAPAPTPALVDHP